MIGFKLHKLTRKTEFNDVFKNGRNIKGKYLLVKFIRNNLKVSRFGVIIPSKKYTSAVQRNRLRRVIKETLIANNSKIGRGDDILVIVMDKNEESLIKNELLDIIARKPIKND